MSFRPWKSETVARHVAWYRKEVRKYIEVADKLHVTLREGNGKTGSLYRTVSLIPVVDCGHNCAFCARNCYDVSHDMKYHNKAYDVVADINGKTSEKPACAEYRFINSAIHSTDPARYWREISEQVHAFHVLALRINVGGDMSDADFFYLDKVAKENPNCMFQFFTKNYEGLNTFTKATGGYPSNVYAVMSAWVGVKMENPYFYPESHVLFPDGVTTLPKGAKNVHYCNGNCSECAFCRCGCMGAHRATCAREIFYIVLIAH